MSKIRVLRGWRAIFNVHERAFAAPGPRVGAVLDSLASAQDQLWPGDKWPPMVLDRGWRVGSTGGHSKIRYTVSDYL
jgi:hypothetical protein